MKVRHWDVSDQAIHHKYTNQDPILLEKLMDFGTFQISYQIEEISKQTKSVINLEAILKKVEYSWRSNKSVILRGKGSNDVFTLKHTGDIQQLHAETNDKDAAVSASTHVGPVSSPVDDCAKKLKLHRKPLAEICHELWEKTITFKANDGRLLCEAFNLIPECRSSEVVTIPMNLLKIREKIAKEEYDDLEQMSADIALMVINAQAFFKKRSQEYEDACEFWVLYNESKADLIAELFGDASETEKEGLKPNTQALKPQVSAELVITSPAVKMGGRLTPITRNKLSTRERRDQFERQYLDQDSSQPLLLTSHSIKPQLRSAKSKCFPVDDAVVVDGDSETVKIVSHHVKLLQFNENYRPAYYGTWRKNSSVLSPKNPFKMDTSLFDYDVDSDEEWKDGEPDKNVPDTVNLKAVKDPASILGASSSDKKSISSEGLVEGIETMNKSSAGDNNDPQHVLVAIGSPMIGLVAPSKHNECQINIAHSSASSGLDNVLINNNDVPCDTQISDKDSDVPIFVVLQPVLLCQPPVHVRDKSRGRVCDPSSFPGSLSSHMYGKSRFTLIYNCKRDHPVIDSRSTLNPKSQSPGGLLGKRDNPVIDSHSTLNPKFQSPGGLLGKRDNPVIDSHSTLNPKSQSPGGLLGKRDNPVIDSLSTLNPKSQSPGGLLGKRDNPVIDSLSTLNPKARKHRFGERFTHSAGIGEISLYCLFCRQMFINDVMMLRHNMERHGAMRPYTCGSCHTMYSNISSLHKHCLDNHRNDGSSSRGCLYSCFLCKKEFTSCIELKQHIVRRHKLKWT